MVVLYKKWYTQFHTVMSFLELDDIVIEEVVNQLLKYPHFLDIIDPIDPIPVAVPKQSRQRKKIRFSTDYGQTNWGKFLADPAVKDPSSPKGRLFRRRFRVPYAVFCWICHKCEEKNGRCIRYMLHDTQYTVDCR